MSAIPSLRQMGSHSLAAGMRSPALQPPPWITTSAGIFAAFAAGRAFPGNHTSIPWRGCGPYFAFSMSGARMVFAGWLTGFFSHER